MPTLKDIQEQEIKHFLEDCECTGYRCNHEISGKHYIIIPEDIHHITTIAHQACLDMVLKEIDGMKQKHAFKVYEIEDIKAEAVNQALSSLKEKIISNSK